MIKFYTHNEIDKQKWDECISNSINSFIYGYSWYLDAVAPEWNALILNDYEAVMPLPTTKKIFTIAYQPFFTQQLGIFYKKASGFAVSEFLGKIPGEYKYINICINEKNDSTIGSLKAQERNNFILHLHTSYDKLFKNFSDHCRRNIKKAEKSGLKLLPAVPDEVVDFYIEHKGEQTELIKESDYSKLRTVLKSADSRNMLECVKAVNDAGDVLAYGAFYLQSNRIIYQVGASNETGRELRATYFIFNEMIRKYSGTDFIFDFEGSDIKSVARFFTGFGSMGMPYYRILINRLPWPFNWLKK